ncbi:MAG: hypothetical protein ACRD9R_17110, partial [Pyrinomonadaceae bacterium]
RQALILGRRGRGGELLLRYLPVARLSQNAGGKLAFQSVDWTNNLPLKIWEDAQLLVPEGHDRARWLGEWHTDLEWLRALHRTQYSNALIGLHEQLARHDAPATAADVPGLSADEQLIRRFRRRQRALVEPELLVLANNHWNFDVRGFNPGGNHGSFFRVSTHSTLMFSGGEKTGIPQGFAVTEPYDSLSFVPTVLALTAQTTDDAPFTARPTPVGFNSPPSEPDISSYPGRVIKEIFAPARPTASPVIGGGAVTEGTH